MNIKSIVIVIIAVAAASTAASGQNKVIVPGALQTIRPNDAPSQAERITALESQVAQLTAQLKTLNTKLDQTSKTAFDANFKAGVDQIWINDNGDGAVKAAQWVNTNGVTVAQNSTAVSDKLDKVLTIVTDVQHRQAITCYGVFGIAAQSYDPYKSHELELCRGAFWNPGVATGYLNKMIPFAY